MLSSAVQPIILGSWPTPVEPLARCAQALGLGPEDLWIKRDDVTGLGGGGNKIRKLQYTCAQALAVGADDTDHYRCAAKQSRSVDCIRSSPFGIAVCPGARWCRAGIRAGEISFWMHSRALRSSGPVGTRHPRSTPRRRQSLSRAVFLLSFPSVVPARWLRRDTWTAHARSSSNSPASIASWLHSDRVERWQALSRIWASTELWASTSGLLPTRVDCRWVVGRDAWSDRASRRSSDPTKPSWTRIFDAHGCISRRDPMFGSY